MRPLRSWMLCPINIAVFTPFTLIGTTEKAIRSPPVPASRQLGISLYAVSMISWLIVLSRVELSDAYPMISLGYVLVVLLSYLVLHEPLSAAKLVGVGVICIGVLILSRHS